AVLGTDNTVENFGEVSVNAEAADIALALGLASFDMGDEGTTVYNHGSVSVAAAVGPESRLAMAAGIVGIGTDTALENRETGSLEVMAFGGNAALALGMGVLGEENAVENHGDLSVA